MATHTTDPDLIRRKSKFRDEMKSVLDEIGLETRHQASIQVCGRILGLDAFARAETVMLYRPFRSELDVTPIALRSFQLGKTVCIPRVMPGGHEMLPIETRSFEDHAMEPDAMGMPVPRLGAPVPLEQVDLVIVPGVAFDLHGRRLGRGGGHYDRFLPRLRRSATLVGLAFDRQVVDEVPDDHHDVRMDIIVSERRTTYTGAVRVRV